MQAIEIDTVINDRHEIHLTLPSSARKGAARVIVLFDNPLQASPAAPRQFGQYRGQIRIADDFDAPLPDSFWSGGLS